MPKFQPKLAEQHLVQTWTCRSYDLLEVTRALLVPPHPPLCSFSPGQGWRAAANEEAFGPLGTRKYLVAFNGEAL